MNQTYRSNDKTLDIYYQEVAGRVKWDKNTPPTIILTLGLARTGTTASLNLSRGSLLQISEQKIQSIPVASGHLKGGVRHAMLDWKENKKWVYEIPNTPLFHMKENIGPYTENDSIYNPLKIFDFMNYPLHKVFVVVVLRDPIQCLASWIENWSTLVPKDTLISNFITSLQTLDGIYKTMKTKGVDHTVFLYETIRDNSPQVSAEALYSQINKFLRKQDTGMQILLSENTTKNWNSHGETNWKPDQPKIYMKPLIYDRAHSKDRISTEWGYKQRSQGELARILLEQDLKKIEEGKVPIIYEYFRLAGEQQLDLKIKESRSFQELKEGLVNKPLGIEGKTVKSVSRK